jgi:ABC-type amino acid transport system permease subunit
MINGSLRVIMVMTYGAIAWSTMLWCATLLLIRAGVFEAMPPKVEVVSIVAGVPLLVMIFIKYYYIKHNQIKMEE